MVLSLTVAAFGSVRVRDTRFHGRVAARAHRTHPPRSGVASPRPPACQSVRLGTSSSLPRTAIPNRSIAAAVTASHAARSAIRRTAHRHPRCRHVRVVHGNPARAVGHPLVHHPREIRAPRRHLVGQHLPGCAMRRPLAPVLVLLRAEPGLVARVRAAARDPRVHGARGRAMVPAMRTSVSIRNSSPRTSTNRASGWSLRTRAGDTLDAEVLVCSTAPLSSRACPTFPGWRVSAARSCTPPAGITRTT